MRKVQPIVCCLLLLLAVVLYTFAFATTVMLISVELIFFSCCGVLSQQTSYYTSSLYVNVCFFSTDSSALHTVHQQIKSHTTLKGLAADAVGDVECEAQLTADWSRTEVYIAFC